LLRINHPVKITEIQFFSTFVRCESSERELPDGGTREVCFWPQAFTNYQYPVHLYNWDINHRTSAAPVLIIYELRSNELHNQRDVRLYQSIFRPTRAEALANIEYTSMNLLFRDWRDPPPRMGVYFHRFRLPERGQFVLNPNKRYVVAVSTVPFVDDEHVWPEMQVEPAIVTAPNLSGPYVSCSVNQGGGAVPSEIMLSALGSALLDDIRIPGRNYSCGDPYYYWPGSSRYRSRHGHVCTCLQIHRELGITSPFNEVRDARPNLGVVGIKGVRLNTCGADVDCSGCVDDSDLLSVLFKFGESGYPREDVNGDFSIDDADLLEVLFNFGNGC
jgi:hypothetical protein